MTKDEADYKDSYQNVLGAMFVRGNSLFFVDLALGKNHPWIGPNYGSALAEGGDDKWHYRFNINMSYKF
jgi:hypothetical protein